MQEEMIREQRASSFKSDEQRFATLAQRLTAQEIFTQRLSEQLSNLPTLPLGGSSEQTAVVAELSKYNQQSEQRFDLVQREFESLAGVVKTQAMVHVALQQRFDELQEFAHSLHQEVGVTGRIFLWWKRG